MTIGRRLLALGLSGLASICCAGSALAAWPTDSLTNLPICTVTGEQLIPDLATDGVGGAFITWYDRRGTTFDIYAQHALASGTVDPSWPTNGLAICTAAGDQGGVCIVSDGHRGAIVAWQDSRAGNSDIYAQHLLANGTVDPAWPANGRAISSAAGSQAGPVIVADGLGGAVIAWFDARAVSSTSIYAQHVQSNGAIDPRWPLDGLAASNTPANLHERPVEASDGAGGVILGWQDLRADTAGDVYVQHLLASGSVDSNWPVNGRAVCAVAGHQDNPAIATDGAGGALVSWQDDRAGAGYDIYAHHVRANGTLDPAWPVDGRALCSAPNDETFPVILPDDVGGAIVAWNDYRLLVSFSDVYAQHVLATGAVDSAWPVNGRAVCTAASSQFVSRLASDGHGGALLTWQDQRAGLGKDDIYAQHLLLNGSLDPAWELNGAPVCKASGIQNAPKSIADGSGGLIVTWFDERSRGATLDDIYAQRINANGQLGGTVVGVEPSHEPPTGLEIRCGNPVTGARLAVTCLVPGDGPAELQVFDIAGRLAVSRTLQAHANAPAVIDLGRTQRFAAGTYIVRLRQGALVRSRRIVIVP